MYQVLEMAEYVAQKRAKESPYRTAQQPHTGCDDDETASFG